MSSTKVGMLVSISETLGAAWTRAGRLQDENPLLRIRGEKDNFKPNLNFKFWC